MFVAILCWDWVRQPSMLSREMERLGLGERLGPVSMVSRVPPPELRPEVSRPLARPETEGAARCQERAE